MIKRFLKKLIYREKSSSEAYIKHLRERGVAVGENCIIYDPRSNRIDLQNPWMLTIGDHVRITAGVQILTHDYSFSVLSSYDGSVIGSVQAVTIGNNVFIGRNAIILKGVHIGDNVVIGAGSVVSHDCESNCVYAGVPAKKICTIEQMHARWKESEREHAKQTAVCYYNRTGKLPDAAVMREYQELFTDRSEVPESLMELFEKSGKRQLCMDYYKNSSPEFKDLTAFLTWCGLVDKAED